MKYNQINNGPLQKNINKYLNNFINKPNLNFLQIGAHYGKMSEWMLNNVLTENSSKLYDVDTWNKNNNLWGNENIEMFYDQKIKNYTNVIKNKTSSNSFFKSNNIFFDFIYVDGGIEENQTYTDLENSFKFLKNDGLILVDDYGYVQKILGKTTMLILSRKNEIDRFILDNKQKVYNELSHGQMLLRKINNV